MKVVEFKKHLKHVTYRHFANINEYVSFIENSSINSCFMDEMRSQETGKDRTLFTGTETYEEAKGLLINGWESGAKKITEKLKTNVSVKSKQKQYYSVQGYHACVPRYLQGLPDSMIAQKTVSVKQKCIKIYRDIVYAHDVQTEEIMNENMKTLRLIQRLENSGIRVELNIIMSSLNRDRTEQSYCSVCIKRSGSRLNIKQISFPLVHPSMLRRIHLSYIERVPELNSSEFSEGYGRPDFDTESLKDIIKDGYFIPKFVNDEEITDIEKYRI